MKALLLSLLFAFVLCTTANAQWTLKFTSPNSNYLWLLEAVGDNVLFGVANISSGSKAIFKTTDGGSNWISDTLDLNHIQCIHARNSTILYCGILDLSNISRIIKSTDGGLTWNVQSSAFGTANQYVQTIYFFDDNNGLAYGWYPINGYHEIYTTTNAGVNWVRVPNSNIPQVANDEHSINITYSTVGNTILIPQTIDGSNQRRVFKSTDKGYTWTASDYISAPGINYVPSSIVLKNQMDGILILSECYSNNSNYKLYKTNDGGNTWVEMSFPLDIDPAFMSSIPGMPQGYLVTAPLGEVGSAYTFDGGNTWQLVETTLDLSQVTFTSETVGWSTSWNTPTIYKWSGPPLPVELTSFTATSNGKEVILNWSTATELNNQLFEVQRSFEGNDFATIGFVNGKGTTTERQDYSYSDKNLSDGKYFYRLKQIDYLGRYEYSDVLEVDYRAFNSYLLEQNYPNPFNPTTTIGFGIKEKSFVKVVILNNIGEEVALVVNEEMESGFHSVEFNAANLPSGVYFYQLIAGEFASMKKMILLR